MINEAVEAIRTNPFGEFTARTKWMPKAFGESLLADVRRRLEVALAKDEADNAPLYAAQALKAERPTTGLLKSSAAQNETVKGEEQHPTPCVPIAHKKRERSPTSASGEGEVVKGSSTSDSLTSGHVKRETTDAPNPLGSSAMTETLPSSFKSALQAAKAKASQQRIAQAAAAATVATTTTSAHHVADVVAASSASIIPHVAMQTTAPQPRANSDVSHVDDEEEESFDVYIPDAVRSLSLSASMAAAAVGQSTWTTLSRSTDRSEVDAAPKHASQMTKDEYMTQFKRAPRRGEIGISAEQVAEAQALGYVMSGSRNRASDKYVDRIQRQLHEKQASQLRLNFLQESDRRAEAATMDFLKGLLEEKK